MARKKWYTTSHPETTTCTPTLASHRKHRNAICQSWIPEPVLDSYPKSDLPPGTERLVRAPPTITFKDANRKRLPVSGKIRLHVYLGSKRKLVRFYVADKFSVSMILGCDFCDKNVEANPHAWVQSSLMEGPLSPSYWSHWFVRQTHGHYLLIKSTSYRRNSWVQRFRSLVLSLSHQIHRLCSSEGEERRADTSYTDTAIVWTASALAGTGIAQVKSKEPFCILKANFGKESKTLLTNQTISTADMHRTGLVDLDVPYAKLLGPVEEKMVAEKTENKKPPDKVACIKRQMNVRDTGVINLHLAINREAHMKQHEKPVTANDIP